MKHMNNIQWWKHSLNLQYYKLILKSHLKLISLIWFSHNAEKHGEYSGGPSYCARVGVPVPLDQVANQCKLEVVPEWQAHWIVQWLKVPFQGISCSQHDRVKGFCVKYVLNKRKCWLFDIYIIWSIKYDIKHSILIIYQWQKNNVYKLLNALEKSIL